MKHLFFSILICLCSTVTAVAQDSEVETVIQVGHYIRDFDVSPNEQYVVTTDGKSVALWNLPKRRIIKRMPINADIVRCHPTNPRRFYAFSRAENISDNDNYIQYDIFTGQKLGLKAANTLPKRKKSTTEVNLLMESGFIKLVSFYSNEIVGVLDSRPAGLAGTMDLNLNDSLLLVTGLMPWVWDLKAGRLVTRIPLIDFDKNVKEGSSLVFRDLNTFPPTKKHVKQCEEISALGFGRDNNLVKTRRNPFSNPYGWRNYCDGYFTTGDDILLGSYTPYITRWGIDGTLKERQRIDYAPVFSFYDNGIYRMAATNDGICWGKSNAPLTSHKTFNSKNHKKRCYSVCFLNDNRFYAAMDNGFLGIGKLDDKDYFKSVKIGAPIIDLCPNPDNQAVLVAAELGNLVEVPADGVKGTVFRYNTEEFNNSRVESCAFLPNGYVAASSTDGILGLWRRGVAKAEAYLRPHSAVIHDIKASYEGTRFFTSDEYGGVMIWDAATREPLLKIQPITDGSYVFITPDNYYMGKRDIWSKLHFAKGLEVFGFDQFDLKYNRPDKIMEILGADKKTIEFMHHAWHKRLAKMGFTEEMLSDELHAPKIEVTNRRSIPMKTENETITMTVKATDTKYKLSRLMVSLNGVPLNGKYGTDISANGQMEYSDEISIELASGKNLIEVSCMNENGVESYAEEVHILCNKPSHTPDLYIAAIGVSQYMASDFNLGYAAKDAEDFANTIEKYTATQYSHIHKAVLTDSQVKGDVLSTLRQFVAKAQRDDVVMLFYAGHGVLDQDMDYYLATHDLDFNNPNVNGIPYEVFEEMLDGIKPLKRFCFIDACHSGELDKNDYIADNTTTVESEMLVFRSVGKGVKAKSAGLEQMNSLMSQMFIDLRHGSGATVLSSSDGAEVSMEGKTWKNGLFTWAIKKGIVEHEADIDKDKSITIDELSNYVSQKVSTLSKGAQTPNIRTENRQQQFVISTY